MPGTGASWACAGAGPPGGRRGRSGRGAGRRAAGHHHHAGADLGAFEQIGHVVVQHADAARRDELADRRRLVGAVDAIDGRTEIHRAGAERVAGAAGHEARQIGLALDHFGRRMPIRPLGLAGDLLHAGPGETVAADADAVADRATATEHVIEVGVGRIDDDGARGLLGRERDFLAAQVRRQLHGSGVRLLIHRQCRQLHRPAVGSDGGLLLDRSGCAGRGTNAFGRAQTGAVVVRIDNAGAGNAAVAAIGIGRLLRRRTAIAIDHRRRTGRTAITGIIGRHHRAGRHRRATIGIDRRGAAITRIGRRHHRAGRRQRGRTLRVRRLVVFQRVEIGGAGATAFIDRITAGHIGAGSGRIHCARRRRIGLLRLGKRGSRRAHGSDGTNRQNAVNHHRFCIDPKAHRTVNGRWPKIAAHSRQTSEIRPKPDICDRP